ncbi:hypothetical protein OG264_15940 [Streptomyces xanthophaeus]|uniref:hypothetical protein n=1 Tax=Streptomyces xanthophaeus TaxID=67385 RepID=UPI00386F73D1|nr:hypothetical protein OG264_15940 [Streptomyces xanthophaeus]WST62175.1 hypothetical protein OG605_22495 [Streptomyces xanthophaeus]
MTGWIRSNRRLRAEVAYLKCRLEEAKARPVLVVKPGPPPAAAPAAPDQVPPPYDVEELLRGQIRALQAMKTLTGAARLASENRRLRLLTAAQQDRLEVAQRATEGSDLQLQLMTDRAVTAEEELAKRLRLAEFPGVGS